MFISNAQKENLKMEIISLKERIQVQEKAMEEAVTIIRLLTNKIGTMDAGKSNSGWDIEARKKQSNLMKEMWKQKKEKNGNDNRTGR